LREIAHQKTFLQKGVMLSPVEAWWASLCAQPFDGAQGDTPFFLTFLFAMSIDGLSLSQEGIRNSHAQLLITETEYLLN
jgi:hypothetical protein